MWLDDGKSPEPITFRTSDTSLAAYLYYIDVKLLGIELERNRGVFIFTPPPDDAVEGFLAGKTMVIALLYYKSYKAMLKRLDERRQQIASRPSII